MVEQLKNNLKKLEELASRSSSFLSQQEELYKEIAATTQQPTEIVEKETIGVRTFTFYLLTEYSKAVSDAFKSNSDTIQSSSIQLKATLEFYRELEKITIPRLALLSSELIDDIEQLITYTNNLYEKFPRPKIAKFILNFTQGFIRQSQEILEYDKLLKQAQLKGEELKKVIKNKKNNLSLQDYPWGEFSKTLLDESNQFYALMAFKNLSKTQQDKLIKDLQEDREEYLEELGIQQPTFLETSIVATPEDNLDYSPDAIKKRLTSKYTNRPKKQGLSWEEENELLKMMIKDAENESLNDYTPEEIAAFHRIQKRLEDE